MMWTVATALLLYLYLVVIMHANYCPLVVS